MKPRNYFKLGCVLLAAVLVAGAGFVQTSLNADRARLKLTRLAPVENMPPVLTLTTVALGGFRGLIANVLWIRANDLQQDEKFFEAVQLADWITKLQPHFSAVWVHQAWNMAYNISVKFPEQKDRWLWVERGIELLRDEGLKYNPQETLIYRELAWFFQHKMGANLDAAHMYYKQQWAAEMERVLGGGRPNWDELIDPKTDDARARRQLLVGKYKLDPKFAREVDAIYGPLEWRLPESHAIYWAVLGLRKVETRPPETGRIDDPITLRRVIYQSLALGAVRGRLIFNPADRFVEFGPNLALIPKANTAYEEMIRDDQKFRDNIVQAHRNFLKQAVNDYYIHGRENEAIALYAYARKRYPDYQDFKPADVLSFVFNRYTELVNEGLGRDKAVGLLETSFRSSYYYEALNENDLAFGYQQRAKQLWIKFEEKAARTETNRLHLQPIVFYASNTLARVLNDPPPFGFSEALRAMLRTARGLPQPTNAPVLLASRATNAPPPTLVLDNDTPEEKDRKTGLAFLAKNKLEGGVRTTPSGMQYLVLEEGKRNGRTPKPSDTVRVHYTGWLLNGAVFDSSRLKGVPFECRPDGEIIKGWKEALLMMKEGAKWKLVLPWQLAYGEAGKGADIRPYNVLIFEIELLDVKSK